jgi:hypothetical protein
MLLHYLRPRSCARRFFHVLAIAAIVIASPLASAAMDNTTATAPGEAPQGWPTYSVDWHVITNVGLLHARNSCFDLSGTVGQPTPGYSSSAGYQVISGFWTAAPKSGRDAIFFNGFEGCGS